MLLGLDSYSYRLAFGSRTDIRPHRPMDLFTFLDRVTEYGYDGFQIDPMHLRNVTPGALESIREEAEERSLFIQNGVMHLSRESILEGIRTSRILGSRVLRAFLGFNRFAPDTDVEQEIARARVQIASCTKELRDAGVVLAIENHGDVRSSELVELVKQIGSPAVGICMDTGNTLMVLEDPYQAVERMLPFAVTTHFKDCTITGTDAGCKITGTILGQGIIPLTDIFRVIREQGTLDHLIVEIHCDAGQGEEKALGREDNAVRESARFCRDVLGIRKS